MRNALNRIEASSHFLLAAIFAIPWALKGRHATIATVGLYRLRSVDPELESACWFQPFNMKCNNLLVSKFALK
jgi:hypothetical protein